MHYDESDPVTFERVAGRGGQRAGRRPGPGGRRTALAGRARAVDVFGWDNVAAETVSVYQSAIDSR